MLQHDEKIKLYKTLYSTISHSPKGELRNLLLDYISTNSFVKNDVINYLIENKKNCALIGSILINLAKYQDYSGQVFEEVIKKLDYSFLVFNLNLEYYLIKTKDDFEKFKFLLQEMEDLKNSEAESLAETKKFNSEEVITCKKFYDSLTQKEKELTNILLESEYDKNLITFCSTLENLKKSFSISKRNFREFSTWLENGLEYKISKDKITLYKKRVELANLFHNFKDEILNVDILNDSKIRLLYKSKNDKESLIKEIKKILKEKK